MSDPTVPERLARRPTDHRGYHVPWFVTEKDDRGRWEFRVVRPERADEARRRRVCWICGEPLGVFKAFAIGPMCTVNRISAEPPQHTSCALYAAHVCPFMINPAARRRMSGLPEVMSVDDQPGEMITRNPGVVAVWVCRTVEIERSKGGCLWRLGDPISVFWYCRGAGATHEQVEDAIRTGLPTLQALADEEGTLAQLGLAEMVAASEQWRPRA